MRTIDLNADLGESFGRWTLGDDEAMLDVVTSANVACGFHAGDPRGAAARLRAGRRARRGRRRAGRLPRPGRLRPPLHRPRPRRPAGRRDLPDRRAARHLRGGRHARCATSSRTARSTTPSCTTRRRPPRWSRPCAGSTPRCPLLGLPGSVLLRARRGRRAPDRHRGLRRPRLHRRTAPSSPAAEAGRGAARPRDGRRPRRAAGRHRTGRRRRTARRSRGRRRVAVRPRRQPRARCRWPRAVRAGLEAAGRDAARRSSRSAAMTADASAGRDRSAAAERRARRPRRGRLASPTCSPCTASCWVGDRAPGSLDAVPGARTLLLVADVAPALAGIRSRARLGLRQLGRGPTPGTVARSRGPRRRDVVEIAVHYDGPDLAEVAALTGLSPDEVVAAHTGTAVAGRLRRLRARLRLPRRRRPAAATSRVARPRGPGCRPAPSGWPASSAASTRAPPPAGGSSSATPTRSSGTSTATRPRCCGPALRVRFVDAGGDR